MLNILILVTIEQLTSIVDEQRVFCFPFENSENFRVESNGKGQNTREIKSKGETLYTYNKLKSLIVDAITFVASL
ncbi:hypothetical protein [Nostoc sp. 'Peltigera malacea cyanobiont' DB3992]|uniref:hypothetical protein n=1 Tax=Nostoc sp. 'Peltigera malacea cyanobiont' DB3992 TaxID=1206980 RepID=UPI000C039F6E|nr:hypothetical protein [Nostoc sp. 'Peltigera malacea cyanobiont' DB3992]PHM09113.1 hypothetical protein CK516_16545 [Nostoc sp. 'Peltigera malacea cyanobiont' DB3992]